jgi:hypothetical protein
MTTVAELLDIEGAAPRRALVSRVGPVLAGSPAAVLAGPSLAGQVVDAISSLIRVPVGSLALVAWGRYRTVVAACRETAESTDARKVISLREHTMSITQSPTVEIDVGGTSHRLLELTLAVTLRFTAAELVVGGGRVQEVRPGPALGSATLSTGGIELARRDLAPVTLPGSIHLASVGAGARVPQPT